MRRLQTYTAQHLLTPPSPKVSPLGSPEMTGEALIRSLLDAPIACAVRIGETACHILSIIRPDAFRHPVPVRNTDFGVSCWPSLLEKPQLTTS